MQIRDATPGDIAAVQAIYAHHVLHGLGTFETAPPGVEEMQRRHAQITDDGFPYYSESGHFVRWLLTQISPAEFRELYQTATYANGVWDTMVDLYGPTLEQDYADTKPYIWIGHRLCADMPFWPAEPEGSVPV